MSNGSNIRVVGPDNALDAQAETAEAITQEPIEPEQEWADEWEDDSSPRSSRGWIAPGLALLIIAGWTAFYGWAHYSQIVSGGTPQQWSEWVIAWSVPVLLVVAVWILAARNSTREAVRFGEIARTLSGESAALETRLSVINRELSIARDFLRSQSRELESLGRVAGERLSAHADHLQGLIHTNGAQVDAIATVSATALENMGRLRDDLPVIANSARDVTNNIGNAGRTAHDQIAELASGFERLNEFGEASHRHVTNLQNSVDAALDDFEARSAQFDAMAEARFEALRAAGDEFRTEVDKSEVGALAALRRRADALADELMNTRSALEEQEAEALVSLRARLTSLRDDSLAVGQSFRETEDRALATWDGRIADLQTRLQAAVDRIASLDEAALAASQTRLQELTRDVDRVGTAMAEKGAALDDQIARRRDQMSQDEQEAIESLSARLAGLDEAIAARREEQLRQSERLVEYGDSLSERLRAITATLDTAAEQGSAIEGRVLLGADALSEKLGRNRQEIDGTVAAIAALTEDTVRLLELIRAGSDHSRDILPAAIGDARDQIAAARDQVDQITSVLGEASAKSAELSEYVLAAKDDGQDAMGRVEQYHTRISAANAEHREEIGRLEAALTELSAQSASLSDTARSELRDSIAQLEQSARDALGQIKSGAAIEVSALAERIGKESAQAIDESMRAQTAEVIEELQGSITKAAAAGHETTSTLRAHLGKVNELTSNLEARINRARERAEEQVDHDFSRRVALITESLNSHAIDISKALSNEVTDTAWASYLRGDRGIFTRRAVRLLDNTEARDIAEAYASDGDFAENVSRYIHDFEAMLRVMLSTRDGNALGVTLLSSDMGKLYVALAQAIERLRN